jgi:hypothetical protein
MVLTLLRGPRAASQQLLRSVRVSSDPVRRVHALFNALLTRDGAGGSWLSALLQATPYGPERLGELASTPGWLEATVAVHTETGRRGAFEYPAAPTRALLRWYIDHADELTRPADAAQGSPETLRLRRALLDDAPEVRARARDRARDLVNRPTSLSSAWWRFEEARTADCVLITDRLVVVVQGRDDGAAAGHATPWFPARSELVRDLEAARRLADGGKAYGVLVLSGASAPDGAPDDVAAAVAIGAPQLDPAEQAELAGAWLGDLSWEQAARATGLQLADVPAWPG